MSDEPARGLQFPCQIPIKAMGPADAGLKDTVVAIVAQHVDELDPDQVRSRPSSAGRYESITVVVNVQSRQQLETIYGQLARSDSVLWTL